MWKKRSQRWRLTTRHMRRSSRCTCLGLIGNVCGLGAAPPHILHAADCAPHLSIPSISCDCWVLILIWRHAIHADEQACCHVPICSWRWHSSGDCLICPALHASSSRTWLMGAHVLTAGLLSFMRGAATVHYPFSMCAGVSPIAIVMQCRSVKEWGSASGTCQRLVAMVEAIAPHTQG